MKKTVYIAFAALGFCACNNDVILNDTLRTPVVYHFSLEASFDSQTKGVTFDADGQSISTQFESDDKIYIYNETKQAFARFYNVYNGDYELSYLQPGSISADGSSCTLTGELSFYKLDEEDEWVEVTIEGGDEYSLFYQMNDPDYFYSSTKPIPRFDYSLQDGSASSASDCDFAEATGITMTLSGTTLTVPNGIRFENLQSMFRQRLSFTKEGETVTPGTITKLTVGTINETLLFYYRPDQDDPYWAFDSFDIDDPVITSDGDIYLSLAFYYTEDSPAAGDQLVFTAIDNEGNVYQCAKNVPEGGFQKSRYYYGTSELEWQYQKVKPALTRSDGGDDDELIPDSDGMYDIYSNDDDKPAEVTISGNSMGYNFWFKCSAVITLDGNGTASSSASNNDFICADYDIAIVLASDYTIICPNYETAIWAGYYYGGLKLSTNTGREQKLTVTTNNDYYCGIYGDDNYYEGEDSSVNDLAATGFTVTRSETQENSDGTYTWVYTVTPNE